MATSSLTILQSNTVFSPNLSSYQVTLSVTNAVNITPNVFLKQRIKNPQNVINDIFVGIPVPAQLESLGVKVPTADTSYFLDSSISLVANTMEYLNEVVSNIVAELQDLVTDVELINNTAQSSLYTITSGNIMINTYESHQHYRLPLTAAPCGTPVDTGGTVTITGVDSSLRGWLPTSGATPGYFYYNIATDPNLPVLWPPNPNKIQFAHLEQNGVDLIDGTVVLNNNGIYWMVNAFGETPWPANYVSPSNTGSPAMYLLIDFIV